MTTTAERHYRGRLCGAGFPTPGRTNSAGSPRPSTGCWTASARCWRRTGMSPARSRMICVRRWRACCGGWRRRGRAPSARGTTLRCTSTPRSTTSTACWKPSARCSHRSDQTGARRAGFRNLDLAALGREVAEAFQPAAADEGKVLAIDLACALPMRGDKELLTQLIANLVDNAIRHTPAGAHIEITSATVGDPRQLIVADDGRACPPRNDRESLTAFIGSTARAIFRATGSASASWPRSPNCTTAGSAPWTTPRASS